MDNYFILPNFYISLDDCNLKSDEWLECPICKHKPKLWIFDNGRYAKCGCNEVYGKSSAEAISIYDFFKKNKTTEGYSHNDLRDNWNKVAISRNA